MELGGVGCLSSGHEPVPGADQVTAVGVHYVCEFPRHVHVHDCGSAAAAATARAAVAGCARSNPTTPNKHNNAGRIVFQLLLCFLQREEHVL